jgi:hypothetical protein
MVMFANLSFHLSAPALGADEILAGLAEAHPGRWADWWSEYLRPLLSSWLRRLDRERGLDNLRLEPALWGERWDDPAARPRCSVLEVRVVTLWDDGATSVPPFRVRLPWWRDQLPPPAAATA